MKNLFIILVSVFTMLPSVSRSAEPQKTQPVFLSTVADLAVNSSSASFRVDYPGLGADAVCSIELKLSPNVFVIPEQLDEVLVVEENFDHELMPILATDSKTGTIALKLYLYVTAFTISSRDGRPLKEVLRELGVHQRDLVLTGKGCN